MRDPATTLLSAVMILSACATAALCFWYLQCTRRHNALQHEVEVITRNRTVMQGMLNDAMEYSKTNPAILPVLQNVSSRTRGTNSPATTRK